MELKENSNEGFQTKCNRCGRECQTNLALQKHKEGVYCKLRTLFLSEIERAEKDGFKVDWYEDCNHRLLGKNIFRLTPWSKERPCAKEAVKQLQDEGILSKNMYKLWWDDMRLGEALPRYEGEEVFISSKNLPLKTNSGKGYIDAYAVHTGVIKELFKNNRFHLWRYWNSVRKKIERSKQC